MNEIIPAIIPQGYDDLRRHLLEVRKHTDRVQIDILDGIYTPGVSASWPLNGVDNDIFRKIASQEEGLPFWQEFDFDIDLMTTNSFEHAKNWISAGASRIIFHLKSIQKEDLQSFILEKGGLIDIGYAIGIDDDISLFDQLGITEPQLIQCMGAREIGEQGNVFDEDALGKIGEIRKRFPLAKISVDIGINNETGKLALEAGANILVVGSYIFKSENPIKTLEELKNI